MTSTSSGNGSHGMVYTSSQPYSREVMNQIHGVMDDKNNDFNELTDEVVLGLPWQYEQLVEIKALLRHRANSKVKFFIGAVLVFFFALLSLPAMIYAVNEMANLERAVQLCAVLGCLVAFAFIVVFGVGCYFKHLDFEIQNRVVALMKEQGLDDPKRYKDMHVDTEYLFVV